MNSTLFFNKATLDRFNTITVTVSNQYFSKKETKFYLRNNTLHKIIPMDIISSVHKDEKTVYTCKISEIELGYRYVVVNQEGFSISLEIGSIAKDPKFDAYFSYDGHDLGTTYTPLATHFAVFAPLASNVIVEYTLNHKTHTMMLERCDHGIYRASVVGDLENASYVYLIEHGNVTKRVCDLYSYLATTNHQESIVINLASIQKVNPLTHHTKQPIIYELSVRDFSHDHNISFNHRKTFDALHQKGLHYLNEPVGFDYLKNLGITHVQLLPIHDFATVEELDHSKRYNWGYDPIHLFVLEGSYCIGKGVERIDEFINMVNTYHEHNIGVIVDVVFNHMYDVLDSFFHNTVPHYYYRSDENLNYSNGSGCSNDINSESFMVRKYLVDMACRYASILGVDGLRFDLMGILDVETMNEIYTKTRAINPNFIIYGEGWDLDTMLYQEHKAIIKNHALTPGIGYFNDGFRNCIKGNDDMSHIGIMLGNDDYSYFDNTYLPTSKSLHYVACHDNHTLYDYIQLLNKSDDCIDLCNAMVILMPGISFLHAGQEFKRTKKGIKNSYDKDDDINFIDWSLVYENKKHIQFVCSLIEIKKKYIHEFEYYIERINDDVFCLCTNDIKAYFNTGEFDALIPMHYALLLSSKDNVYEHHLLKLQSKSVSVLKTGGE